MDTARVPGRSRSARLGACLYGAMLHVYPAEFRREYGSQMALLFADQLREARRPSALAGVWLRGVVDLASNALGEHLRRDRTVARSLATFEPSRSMRFGGLLAVVGGVLLLWAFSSWNPFTDRHLNSVRLILFWTAGMSIALAYHGRQAAARPLLARMATGVVVLVGAWNVVWVLLAWDRSSPFSGEFGTLGFLASLLGWLAASFYGAAMLVIGAAWRGMRGWAAIVTRVAAGILLVAGVVATFGMDRLGLMRSEPYGELFGTLGALGVGGVGLAWLLLGVVLLVGGGRSSRAR